MPLAAIYLPPEATLAEGLTISPIPYASSRDLRPNGQLSCMPPANKKFESHGMSRACRVAVRSTLDITRLSNRIPYRGRQIKSPPDHQSGGLRHSYYNSDNTFTAFSAIRQSPCSSTPYTLVSSKYRRLEYSARANTLCAISLLV